MKLFVLRLVRKGVAAMAISALFVSNSVMAASLGVAMVKDINVGAGSSLTGYANMVELNNKVYFTVDDGVNGNELWVSDGTEGGTNIVKDINVGPNGSDISGITVFDGKLFFQADDGVNGRELWVSDGTGPGTSLFLDINVGDATAHALSLSPKMLVVGSSLYFAADNGTDGMELWVTDGTVPGTGMVVDINTGAGHGVGSTLWSSTLTHVDGFIFFYANDGTNGRELWKYDIALDTAGMVKDINPGAGHSEAGNFAFRSDLYVNIGDKVYFAADDGTHGDELWVTNGTEIGTMMVKDINVGASGSDINEFELGVLNNKLYFGADDGVHGDDLWVSDGTEGGTNLMKDITEGAGGSLPGDFVEFDGKLYFYADDSVNGYEVWVIDGTEDGTVMLKDINPGAAGGNPGLFTEFDGYLYFTANDGTNGHELWVTDGTDAGTMMVEDIAEGAGSASLNWLTVIDGALYFFADDGVNGSELWIYSNGVPVLSAISASFLSGAESVNVSVEVNDQDDDDVSLSYYYHEGACGDYDFQNVATISAASDSSGDLVIVDNVVTAVSTAVADNEVVATWAFGTDLPGESGTYCVYVVANDGVVNSSVVSAAVATPVGATGGGSGILIIGNSGSTGGGNAAGNEDGGATAGSGESSAVVASFEDVRGHWAESFVEELREKGVVSGKGDGSFAPEDSITRAELLKMVMEAYEISVEEASVSSFSDVSVNDWFSPYVESARTGGYISGYADGTFRPNDAVNRAEALVIMLRASEMALNFGEEASFADVSENAWYADFVSFAVEWGIVAGYGDGNFGPSDNLTRAQAAKVIVLMTRIM
ncbi:hypothetical protein CVV38_00050 [Candidatus Peregrinibacteria bacterium HGW-Peregrinibacteria-1]|jgi:ELWxxDGT repeat protein|nr:MAG: hypothetical protein CVV38_00050 [Candidatus Peregrinibacteria bacterium HGW-Peregrinibacteria-1]